MNCRLAALLNMASSNSPSPGLVQRWKKLSLRGSWRIPNEWWIPEVDDLAKLPRRSPGFESAARLLGAARYRQGIGIAESLADFRCYFRAGRRLTNIQAIQFFTEGWADAADLPDPISCTDPLTGFSTKAHFWRSLHDLEGRPSDSSMIIATASISPLNAEVEPLRWTQVALLGLIFTTAFSGTQTTLMRRGGLIYILAPDSPNVFAAMMNCHARINAASEFQDFVPKFRFQSLPHHELDISRIMESMNR